jgi:hypothetical protein
VLPFPIGEVHGLERGVPVGHVARLAGRFVVLFRGLPRSRGLGIDRDGEEEAEDGEQNRPEQHYENASSKAGAECLSRRGMDNLPKIAVPYGLVKARRTSPVYACRPL